MLTLSSKFCARAVTAAAALLFAGSALAAREVDPDMDLPDPAPTKPPLETRPVKIPANPPEVALPGPDTYPRAAQPIDVPMPGGGMAQVRPLKTVLTLAKREALADRLIVVFRKPETDESAAHTRASKFGAGIAKPLLKVGRKGVLVDVSGAASLEDAARAYLSDPEVQYASPDWVMHKQEIPNDPSFGSQWGMTTIQASQAWNRTHGSPGVRIAVLDTGINELHADLAGKVVARRDFTGSGSGTDDIDGHGTHVAGIAAASTNNAAGVAGVGYDSSLMNVKVLDDSGSGSVSMLYNGIYWATDNGAHVINMSLGSDEQDCSTSWWEDLFDVGRNELRDSINYAFDRNVVLVAAAGNNGADQQQWPGACPNVLSVANTNSADMRSGSSNFGTWVDVAAPGAGIFSTAVPGASSCQNGLMGAFANCSGTSMASPHVAGIAALVRSSCGMTRANDIVNRITSTANAIAGTGTLWQFGRVNALNAVCFPALAPRITAENSTSIQLGWSDRTPGETHFEVFWQIVGGAAASVILPANSTSFLHSGLSTGLDVDYFVRVCDALGCSDWSNPVHGNTGSSLKVSLSGAGKVTSSPAGINCGGGASDCNEAYLPGTIVRLTARGSGNINKPVYWLFDHWDGACAGQGYVCTLTMSAARSAKAVFVRETNGGL